MYKIYVVEDELDLNKLLKKYLEKEEFEVKTFVTGEEALNAIDDAVDVWVLDIMLPGEISGYDLIKEIRGKNPNMPVIFTSARDNDLDKIVGLELGSDDYLAKPYSPKELILRIKNVIKRVYSENQKVYNLGNYIVNFDKRSVFENNKEIFLTTLEFDLLVYLIKNKNTSLSREQILYNVWGESYFGSDRAVDDLVRRLRKKMGRLDVNTIYGYGYRLL